MQVTFDEINKNNNIIDANRARYELMQSSLVLKGYNPQVFFDKFIINKIKTENNFTYFP